VDWQQVLSATPRGQLEPGATYTLPAAVELPDGCLIVGNGATVTVSGASVPALRVTRRRDVTLTGIRFLGQETDPLGTAMARDHVAVTLTRSSGVRVTDCSFARWRGAGVVVTGAPVWWCPGSCRRPSAATPCGTPMSPPPASGAAGGC
jgi:hypothetical protein